jgi:hypothetical protein
MADKGVLICFGLYEGSERRCVKIKHGRRGMY